MELRNALRGVSGWTWLMWAVSLLGLALRVEHALTFDQVNRASDYNAHLLGVHWTQEHWRPFFLSESANYQIRGYPPLWYFVSALILDLKNTERLLVSLALLGWLMRHTVLWLILREAIPHQRLAQLGALGIHAVLPLSVLVDGKVNPEGLHAGIFALALYALWRIECQSQTTAGPRIRTAASFGGLAGLALLTKATGSLLVVIGSAVFVWQAACWSRRLGFKAAWRKFAAPALIAAAAWLVVAGFWTGTNLVKFHHPFPHVWGLDGPAEHAELANPTLYRRPLGWALPFEWRGYWRFPIIRTLEEPRPNFWATEVAGTWSDIYNRGFCRMKGGAVTDRVWGGRHGAVNQYSDTWAVTLHCVDWFATMVHVGVWLTGAGVLALLWCGKRQLKTWGAYGSLGLVLAPPLCTALAMSFALTFPYDAGAALNPRYLLSAVMPMSACLGLGLGELEAAKTRSGPASHLAKAVLWLTLLLIGVIGAMLLRERISA